MSGGYVFLEQEKNDFSLFMFKILLWITSNEIKGHILLFSDLCEKSIMGTKCLNNTGIYRRECQNDETVIRYIDHHCKCCAKDSKFSIKLRGYNIIYV